MRTYLVGGAVRDQQLALPVLERDWVVVGTTPDRMLELGYRQVGKDFPVFLHPQTAEEYALARKERKQGHGYHGFVCDFSPDVTLEEDLARRDLTINAMAQDENGSLIDPYGGMADLNARLLRHVSDAFPEDPLRVLRVARFAARFSGLGFSIAPETMQLMRTIAESGELQHLTPERIWKETERALTGPAPRRYIEVLRECGALAVLMPEIDVLFGVPQRAEFHPEVDTGLHTLMTLEQAARLSSALTVRFAALVHDLGKGVTPREEWPRHIMHEERGVALVRALSERLRVPRDCRELGELVSRYHLISHTVEQLRPETLVKKLKALDAFRREERFEEFLLACEADARGRAGLEESPYPQADYFREALHRARQVDIGELTAQGLKGPVLADAIDQERARHLTRWKAERSPS